MKYAKTILCALLLATTGLALTPGSSAITVELEENGTELCLNSGSKSFVPNECVTLDGCNIAIGTCLWGDCNVSIGICNHEATCNLNVGICSHGGDCGINIGWCMEGASCKISVGQCYDDCELNIVICHSEPSCVDPNTVSAPGQGQDIRVIDMGTVEQIRGCILAGGLPGRNVLGSL